MRTVALQHESMSEQHDYIIPRQVLSYDSKHSVNTLALHRHLLLYCAAYLSLSRACFRKALPNSPVCLPTQPT
jgi:hypothetical protein